MGDEDKENENAGKKKGQVEPGHEKNRETSPPESGQGQTQAAPEPQIQPEQRKQESIVQEETGEPAATEAPPQVPPPERMQEAEKMQEEPVEVPKPPPLPQESEEKTGLQAQQAKDALPEENQAVEQKEEEVQQAEEEDVRQPGEGSEKESTPSKETLPEQQDVTKMMEQTAPAEAMQMEEPAQEEEQVSEPKEEEAEERIHRIPTGVEGLDEMIEGGLVENSSVLIAGGPGIGKSTLAAQILYEGAKNGERVVYITLKTHEEKLRTWILEQGFDIDDPEVKDKFNIINMDAISLRRLVDKADVAAMEQLTKNTKRVAIDSLTIFENLFKDEYERGVALTKLLNIFEELESTVIIIEDAEQDVHSRHVSSSVEYLVDGIIALYDIRDKGSRNIGLEVVKMKGTDHDRSIHPLQFYEKGVRIFPEVNI